MKKQPTERPLKKQHQQRMLKLVTQSFYKELKKYGFEESDLVTVSLELLDRVTHPELNGTIDQPTYREQFTVEDIIDHWNTAKELTLGEVRISPLLPQHVPTVAGWLHQERIQNTFISLLPKKPEQLAQYFFEQALREYFAIFYQDRFVGFIGADQIDQTHKRIEMKKLVGVSGLSGKGIGKRATFLFLYWAFSKRGFNKVFIHSMDTNIQNINLNSKFGFELEGVFFEEIFNEGNFRDVLRMGLLRERFYKIFG